MRKGVLFTLVVAGNLTLWLPASRAQQAPRAGSTSPAGRGSYFARVQTDAGAASPSSGGPRTRLRLGLTRPPGNLGGAATNDEADRGGPDPLRAYGSEGRDDRTTRPYERPATVSPPERVPPAPAPSHNYFPSLRPGQGSNRNVVHCVPGRGSFLHR